MGRLHGLYLPTFGLHPDDEIRVKSGAVVGLKKVPASEWGFGSVWTVHLDVRMTPVRTFFVPPCFFVDFKYH